MKKRLFVKNAAILSATSLILKCLGILFRIWLSNRMGAEGMGLYQLIFSVYVLGSTLATTGISTAVTRLVTDQLAVGQGKAAVRTLGRALCLSLAASLLSSIAFYLAAPLIGEWWIGDNRSLLSLRILTVGFPFMGISACLKGYFYARRQVSSPSQAQLVEQLSRIAITYWLIGRIPEAGVSGLCAAVMLGDVVSEAISCGFVAIAYWRDCRRIHEKESSLSPPRSEGITKRLVSIAAPITAGRYLGTILRTIENIQVPRCLTVFCGSQEIGLSAFGNLKGMAMPLLFFPSSFLSAFSTLLIPEMSEALALGHQRQVQRTAEQTIRLTLTASWLFAGWFWLFAYPLGEWLYHSTEVGFYLRVLAPLVPIMYLESVVDGILKGLDQQISSLKYSMADSLFRILFIAITVPRYGIRGFLYVMVLSNLLTCSLNTARLCRVSHLRVDAVSWALRPLSALLAAGCATYWLGIQAWMRTLPTPACLLIEGGVMTALYLLLLKIGSRKEGDFLHGIKPQKG